MICAEAKGLLEAYVKGETDAAAREALEAHFATCQGCRLEVELTRSVQGQSDDSGSAPLVLEPIAASQLPDTHAAAPELEPPAPGPQAAAPPQAPPAQAIPADPAAQPALDADDEVSFSDLVLESPEATSTAAPVTPAQAAPTMSAVGSGSFDEVTKPSPALSSKKGPTPSWDFEPVDPPRESGPPAGSVNLAEQAIARKAEAKAKGKVAALRVVLWTAGGLSGIALLGVSIWIALAFNQPSPVEPSLPAGPAASSAPGVDEPGSEGAADSAAGYQTPIPPTDGSTQQVPPPVDGSVSTDGGVGGATLPNDGRVLRAGSLPPGGAGPSDAIVSTPKPERPAPVGSKSTVAAPSPTTSPRSAPTARSPTETPHVAKSGGSRKPIGPKPPPDDLEPVTDESHIPFTAAPRREPVPVPAPSTAGSTQGTSPKPAPSGTGPTEPSAGSGSTAPAEPPPPSAPAKPIDRLHDATATAAAAEDLTTLRKLKITWKNTIRSASASERARAKREYADCLWAIQELSGKTADRREALVAYREYVLYAPAGANDARTVGRMRFLEDVLSESE